ncbi:MAG: hypothetical protein ABFS09_13300, partial [Thermodesulfobacteriota bacterium]
QILIRNPNLGKCQHVIARAHGYSSWQEMKKQSTPEDALNEVMAAHPELLVWGLATFRDKKNYAESGHDRLRLSVDEFRASCEWLLLCKTIKTPNDRIGSSYGLKHRVEKWVGEYISNGAFIAAVFFLGIPYKEYWGSPNISVAISSRCEHLKKSSPSH